MTGVRWRPDTGFEGKCERCLEWWPLADAACWQPKSGLRRCRACLSELTAERNRVRRMDPAVREADRQAVRAARRANLGDADYQRAYYRDLYRKNRDKINALARARYARKKSGEEARLRKRDWMREYRARMARTDVAA